MQRIATILILFILLMNGRHGPRELPVQFDSLVVQARSLIDNPGVATQDYGALRLLGAWSLTSEQESFGGISSLFVRPDGSFLALSDSAMVFSFRVSGDERQGFIKRAPRMPGHEKQPSWKFDAESMATDPETGQIWVGFEGYNRICRFSREFVAIEGCGTTPELLKWDDTRSIESLVRFSDGRFMAIAEGAYGKGLGNSVLVWSGDPLDPKTPPPIHMEYFGPTGYRPTDALWLGGDRLLVMNRRITLFGGLVGRLSLVRLPPLKEGAKLIAEDIADFSPPRLADNFEALALSHENGKPVLWAASDDNHFFLQRNLLLKFALPADWVSDAPAP